MIELKMRPGDRIVELGCGENPHPACAVHVDARQTPGVDFTADFEKPLPIKDSDFDGVFCQYALEHLSFKAVPGFLKECLRILKPGGKVVFATPNAEAQVKWIKDHPEGWDGKGAFDASSELIFGSQDYAENAHKCWLTPATTTALFQDAGFVDLLVQPYNERDTDMVIEARRPLSDKVWIGEKEADARDLAGNPVEWSPVPCGAKGPGGSICYLEKGHQGNHRGEA